MDLVRDTPVKRRKTERGYESGNSNYDSPDSSVDELFKEYETVATIPLPQKPALFNEPTQISSPAPYVTQPTQILERPSPKPETPGRAASIIQVVASSPIRESPTLLAAGRKSGGILANAMAPPGTAFRLPVGVNRPPAKTPAIELSDDEDIQYQGGSSDDDSQRARRVDIKPSVFIQRVQNPNFQRTVGNSDSVQSGAVSNRFKEITSSSFYRPLEGENSKKGASTLSGSVFDSRNRDESNTVSRLTAAKSSVQFDTRTNPQVTKYSATSSSGFDVKFSGHQSSDVMANAYGSTSRSKKPRQPGPAKAAPVVDMSLEDVADYVQRMKIERMRVIIPKYTVAECFAALNKHHGREDDALDYLARLEDEQQAPITHVDLTNSDENETLPEQLNAPIAFGRAKQQLKAPYKSLFDKYSSTQAAQPVTQPIISSLSVATSKPRRRLVQGRKRASSPAESPHRLPPHRIPPHRSPPRRSTTPPLRSVINRHEVDSDNSGYTHLDEDDMDTQKELLRFFNTASVQDIADTATIPESTAELVRDARPFKSLVQVRKLSGTDPTKDSQARKRVKKAIGEKIVDDCMMMLVGYKAVDQLVNEVAGLGRPIAHTMQLWGVDIFGEKVKDLEAIRDSGIGTPTSTTISADEDEGSKGTYFKQPSIMSKDYELKEHQVAGVNWLSLIFEKGLSCILADDMGLGKTYQVIAFLAHLFEIGVKGLHLVVVPLSTLENWADEFKKFCPALKFIIYHGSQNERAEIRERLDNKTEKPDVIITTYGVAKSKGLEHKWLKRLKLTVCVFDEGHQLKNSKSAVYEQLNRIEARCRVLLTGTPLQNNLGELASLLGFILPKVFHKHREDLEYIFKHKSKTTDDDHSSLLSEQRIARARSLMSPFVLRRKKHQVLKTLPAKTSRVEYCELSPEQEVIYGEEKARARKILADRACGKSSTNNGTTGKASTENEPRSESSTEDESSSESSLEAQSASKTNTKNESTNIMMKLRQASIHHMLFRRTYRKRTLKEMAKACLKEEEYRESNLKFVYEDMKVMTDFELYRFCTKHPKTMRRFILKGEPWMDSGKVKKLCELLMTFKANGDRVLVFSQFTLVMDILEYVLDTLVISHFRLDGKTNINERGQMIKEFKTEKDVMVFLLSTKAGGAGINLASANKVIIFDSSFNPQEDIQAENRSHRMGQEREVEVIRLVTKGTIEEQIHALGETKLALDRKVAGDAEEDSDRLEVLGMKKVEELILESMIKETAAEG